MLPPVTLPEWNLPRPVFIPWEFVCRVLVAIALILAHILIVHPTRG